MVAAAIGVDRGLAAEVREQHVRVGRDVAGRHQVDQARHRLALVDRVEDHALEARSEPHRLVGRLDGDAVVVTRPALEHRDLVVAQLASDPDELGGVPGDAGDLVAGLVDLRGDYTLTFEVGGGCEEVPKELRTRTYEATVAYSYSFGSSDWFTAYLSGAKFYDGQSPASIEVTGTSLFLDLLDWPRIFPKVWGLLGWNTQLYHSHMTVTPVVPPEERPAKKRLGWHQDSGRLNQEMETELRPRISLKVAFFLADTRAVGGGNFYVIPGSHRQNKVEYPADGISDPAGATPVCVGPGAAVFFASWPSTTATFPM